MFKGKQPVHPNFASDLKQVYKRFQAEHSNADEGVLLEQNGLYFLGFPVALQKSHDPRRTRHSIESMLGLKVDGKATFIQVVGDSSGQGFTKAAINAIHKAVSDAIHAAKTAGCGVDVDVVIEYGYTAGTDDTNWAVNEFLTSATGVQQFNSVAVIGNIVHASAGAVEQWKSQAIAGVTHFVLAYGLRHDTAFGEDMWLSDSVLMPGDVMICAEGGPQSFCQAARVCAQGVRTIAITGYSMRKEGLSRFSAACLLRVLHDVFQNCTGHPKTGLEDLKQQLRDSTWAYVYGLKSSATVGSPEKHQIINQGLDMFLADTSTIRNLSISVFEIVAS